MMFEHSIYDAIETLQKRVDALEDLLVKHITHQYPAMEDSDAVKELEGLRLHGPGLIKVGGTD